MNGIYVLVTKDGYRIAASDQFVCLFGNYNDDKLNYNVEVDVLNKMFGNCATLKTAKEALEAAKCISKTLNETEDGIMFIDSYGQYTFEELMNGKANKTQSAN
jgi:non-homologous end joining protein Ku